LKKFTFSSLDYEQVLQELQQAYGGTISGNFCYPDPAISEGIYWYLKLADGIQVIFGNNTIHADWFMHRQAAAEEMYVLHFDKLSVPRKIELKYDDEHITGESDEYAVAYLTSTLFDWHYTGTAGMKVTAVDILLPRTAVAAYLKEENMDEVLARYLDLRARHFLQEKMDAIAEEYVQRILDTPADHPMWKMMVQNRVMQLIEHFFTRLNERMATFKADKKIRKEDIDKIRESERWLISDFTVPAPTIPQLASKTAMSPTKFKSLFKTVYGSGVYEYFQKRRMARAAEMLSSGNYSVTDVGLELGYANLSNFTTAFRKEYHKNPSDFLS
jgi:AraC-like DNA-binding protein